jgi:hypothetical protein
MRSVRSVFTLVACLSGLVLAGLPLVADVLSPSSRTSADSTKPVTLSGYVTSPGQTVTVQAIDQDTGSFAPLGTTTAASTGKSYTPSSGPSYTLYPWTYNAGMLAPNYWAPQKIAPNLATSQGHLELSAVAAGPALGTFSPAALAAMQTASAPSPDPPTALAHYADGNTIVLFDQQGVGFGAETAWVNVQGMVSDPPSAAFSSVAWSVGSYTVVNGKKIYALICSPKEGGPYPVLIYNHPGINGVLNTGNLHGIVSTTTGWTISPSNGTSDDLGLCIDWAKRGWVVAMSSYRGEYVNISWENPANHEIQKSLTWTSDGVPELCLGEVTDVMALTDLLVKHASSITVGSPASPHGISVNNKVFMYGWSHGGCITYRAVEQGAAVTAFAVVEGFTDFSLGYLNVLGQPNFSSPHVPLETYAAALSNAALPNGGYYYPDTAGVMGYNWRSAHYFASRGDLSIQKFKTMPIMIFHGDIDINPDNLNGPASPLDYNPVYLDEAVEIADDIGAAKLFVGAYPPTRVSCITGRAGEPILRADHSILSPPTTCPVSFSVMDAADPCVNGTQATLAVTPCKALSLPLPPQVPGGEQPLHYLVVYHNMNHVNGGLAIKNQFGRFVEQNFGRQPGCDGVATICNK